MEDFTYLVNLDNKVTFHFREIKPKDFYFAQILRSKDETSLPLIERTILNPEVLDYCSVAQTRKALEWASTELLEEKVMTVESWLETSFYLCKTRWDSSLDWLETQPISKVLTMIEILKKHGEAQESAMKKSSKGR